MRGAAGLRRRREMKRTSLCAACEEPRDMTMEREDEGKGAWTMAEREVGC